MASEIVKYHNYMNTQIDLTELSSAEINLLMAFCAKLRDKGSQVYVFRFSDIRKLSNFWSTSNVILAQNLENTGRKLIRIPCRSQIKNTVSYFPLFRMYTINLDDCTVTISVNPEFTFLLNDLVNNFTRFELNEFVHLDGRYVKRLYIMLKQFRMVGVLNIDVASFRARMGIPQSYKNNDIMERVIKPTIKTLTPAFKNLSVSTIKAQKRGGPVTRYVFTFSPEAVPATENPEIEDQSENTNASIPQLPENPEKQNKPAYTSKPITPFRPKGSFFCYEQRDYDYDALTKQIFTAQEQKEKLENQKNE